MRPGCRQVADADICKVVAGVVTPLTTHCFLVHLTLAGWLSSPAARTLPISQPTLAEQPTNKKSDIRNVGGITNCNSFVLPCNTEDLSAS